MTRAHNELSVLHGADGSATCSQDSHSVVAAVNGPVEVQRRDELPEHSAVEVNLRSASGVASIHDRHLEGIIHGVLRRVILTQLHPRTLIQINLQLVQDPESQFFALQPLSGQTRIELLPLLLRASLLALISAAIPLSTTYWSATFAIAESGAAEADPSPTNIARATSLHVYTFSAQGKLLLSQSRGSFDVSTWDILYERAKRQCYAQIYDTDEAMLPEDASEAMGQPLRTVLTQQVLKEQAWRAFQE